MLDVRIWDVGAALSIRVVTPTKHNHIIDAGASVDFSPADHIADQYWTSEDKLDYLIISHFDSDHCRDLPTIVDRLGKPRIYLRNSTVPEASRYGALQLGYQRHLKALDQTHTHPVDYDRSPANPTFNGGVHVISRMLTWDEARQNFNDSSIVVSYLYAGVMLIYPGDIGPAGWDRLVAKYPGFLDEHLKQATTKILVAPHHGRSSGYSQLMIDYIRPSAVIVSDAHGAGATDPRFYRVGSGMLIRGEEKSCISTKLKGRKLIKIYPDGSYFIDG